MPVPDFIPSVKFAGKRSGYEYKHSGKSGAGYYLVDAALAMLMEEKATTSTEDAMDTIEMAPAMDTNTTTTAVAPGVVVSPNQVMVREAQDRVNPPPGAPPDGQWMLAQKYVGPETKQRACLGCLCCGLPGLCVSMCKARRRGGAAPHSRWQCPLQAALTCAHQAPRRGQRGGSRCALKPSGAS